MKFELSEYLTDNSATFERGSNELFQGLQNLLGKIPKREGVITGWNLEVRGSEFSWYIEYDNKGEDFDLQRVDGNYTDAVIVIAERLGGKPKDNFLEIMSHPNLAVLVEGTNPYWKACHFLEIVEDDDDDI